MITTVSRRRHHDGFTLIELLVVVIILGVISGVVVFAVRGAGDKGEANAKAADERIVRTAMEAFCATYGRYATSMDELVDGPPEIPGAKGFLSNASTYNHTIVSVPAGENNCGDTGYRIEETTCLQLVDGGEEEVETTAEMRAEGYWCLTSEPGGSSTALGDPDGPIVQLPSGKVLAVLDATTVAPSNVLGMQSSAGRKTALFDPAAGPKGSWTAGPVARVVGGSADSLNVNDMVLLAGPARPDCVACGKVLAHFDGPNKQPGSAHWKIYDPSAAPLGAWTEIAPPSPLHRNNTARALQLLDDPATPGEDCAPQCGKVLIVGGMPTIAELYDPTSSTFQPVASYGKPEDRTGPGYHLMTLTPLRDGTGRVLVLISHFDSTLVEARLFDPATATFESITPPAWRYVRPQPILLDEGVLLLQSGSFGHLYRTEPPRTGDGTWEEVAGCGQSSYYCHPLAQLGGDKAVVYRNERIHRVHHPSDGEQKSTGVYTYPGQPWKDSGDLNHSRSAGPAVLLSGTGCGAHCGKVLMIGDNSAELYNPPP